MYFVFVIATTIVLPIASAVIDMAMAGWEAPTFFLAKWYAFWAGGVRLMLAGVRQSFAPGVTLKQIFEIDHPPSTHIVQELGFANLSIGLVCILSLLYPLLTPAGAISAGVFYGLAGLQHLRRGGRNAQRTLAMITDLIVFLMLAANITTFMWHMPSS